MSVGEMIAALTLCAASGDDYVLMMKNVCSIEVRNECIEVYFVDGNTESMRIFPDGRFEYIQ